jgi:outer membrane immunogenic protein
MKSSVLLSTTLALALTSNAFAADVVTTTEPTPAPVTYDWSGPYIGVSGGGALAHHTMVTGPSATENFGLPTLAVFGGYNWQSSNIVYGIDGSVGYRFGKHTQTGVSGPGTMETKLGLDGALRGRIGMDMGAFLPYVAAGITATQLRTFWPFGPAERDTTLVGGTVGVGADVKLSEKMFLRAEYDFSAYGTKTLNYCGGGCVMDHKLQTHDFIVGVGYKF